MTDTAETLARRFIDRVFVERDPGAVDELVSPDFVSHTFGFETDGPTKLRAATERMRDALTDVRFEIEDVVSDGENVVVRLTASATPTGDFMGVPAAGKRYEIGEIHWFRVADARIVEHWHQHDALGLMRQLGALPTPAPGQGQGQGQGTGATAR